MGPHELSTRTQQEISKRIDFARSLAFRRNGLAALPLTADPAAGKFYFDRAGAASIIGCLKRSLPAQVSSIVADAERICSHRFDLLGYTDLQYGAEIDWHKDAVHGKSAPLLPFYKIRFLNFEQVGDSKVTWELNRHQHFLTLAKAYKLTDDARFVAELMKQWNSWHAHNPYPYGINWASSFEVAIRSVSWVWVYFLFDGDTVAERTFRAECLRELSRNARHIERYLSTFFSPNSHLIGEGIALFFIGVLFPHLRSARRWRVRGWQIIVREASAQLREDGMHFEQSAYYHVYHVDFLLHAFVMARRNRIPVPAEFERALMKALEALNTLARCGDPPKLGDEDGGRFFDPRRNRSNHMRDPLSTGALLFGRGDFKGTAGEFCEETLWLLGPSVPEQWTQLQSSYKVPVSQALPYAGLYSLVDSSKRELIIDAGPQGALQGGHGHADALGICVRNNGVDLLIDPGTGVYIDNAGLRSVFRGTGMHNTLQMDNLDQTERTALFKWATLPHVEADVWVPGDNFDLFAGHHDGYRRLEQPAVHQRWVFSLKRGFWIVRDVVRGDGVHHLALHWHLAPQLRHNCSEGLRFLRDDGTGVAIVLPDGNEWHPRVAKVSWSPAYGVLEPALAVEYAVTARLPMEFCAVIVTLSEDGREAGSLTVISGESDGGVSGYEYRSGAERYRVFFADSTPWRLADCASDAEFFAYNSGNGAGERFVAFNGSWAEIGGRRFALSAERGSQDPTQPG